MAYRHIPKTGIYLAITENTFSIIGWLYLWILEEHIYFQLMHSMKIFSQSLFEMFGCKSFILFLKLIPSYSLVPSNWGFFPVRRFARCQVVKCPLCVAVITTFQFDHLWSGVGIIFLGIDYVPHSVRKYFQTLCNVCV